MEQTSSQWYVKVQGRAIGPLSTAAVIRSLQKKEILPSDEAYTPALGSWKKVEELPSFAVFCQELFTRNDALDLSVFHGIATPKTKALPIPTKEIVAPQIPQRPKFSFRERKFSSEQIEEAKPLLTNKRSSLGILFGVLVIFALFFWISTENKMRDLKDSHLSDPSSPTQPKEASDPISLLKEPTRPQR